MDRRLKLHTILVTLLGSNNVYFQPPASVQMKYPCIVYSRDEKDEKFANDKLYLGKMRYAITVIDTKPDSPIPSKVAELPLTSFSRHFTMDNLNHDIYSTYF